MPFANARASVATSCRTKIAGGCVTKLSGSFTAPMSKHQLVAVDTNVLMRLAARHESTLDAWELIKRRLDPVQFLAPPTVLDELADKHRHDPNSEVRACARLALVEMRGRWQVHPRDFNAVEEAIVANAVRELRHSGLLPYEERNDASILAESSVLKCVLLVSRDSHLYDIDPDKLSLLFRQLDLPAPLIASPENLLKKFYS